MITIQDTIHAELLADSDGHHGGRIPLLLRWNPTNPLFVEIRFPDDCRDPHDSDEPVVWEIGRTVLACGRGVPGGDVWIDRGLETLLVLLRVDGAQTQIQMPAKPVDALLRRSFELVSFGDETPEHQVDAFLAANRAVSP